MPLIVGNLLTDPEAQSFISLADALAYLEPEAAVAAPETAMAQWIAADETVQEASLVRVSRWLAGHFQWYPLGAVELIRVGHVAARLAAESHGRETFAGVDGSAAVKREKVGPIEVEYVGASVADVGGLSFDWLRPMLRGLIAAPGLGIGVMVV
ncbi:hypothetical protein PARHAE_02062 [Paracoccus haematequi]|uniref:Uncharacterized protein n=1 Tax=Paracoccus haematequi TaxID=2491866 RepID=A0A3S4CJW1_9RHOB|nr:hypothetical protein [Paracoccus haematequi]VDS08877.1 hypothetical protein PARHAE_02062 [Paracoccus haematequi]